MGHWRTGVDGMARMGLGAVAGVAATFVMDPLTEVFYTQHIQDEEMSISPKSASAAVAEKMLDALGLQPNEKDAKKAAPVLHWTIGVGAGMIAGFLARDKKQLPMAAAITTAGMLLFDEFGLAAIGATPPSSQYPWQTNFRSLVGHAAYGFALMVAYSTLRSAVGGD